MADGEGEAGGVNLGRRQLLIGGASLMTAGLAIARAPRTKIDLLGDRKLEKIVPTRLGRWTFYSKSGLVVAPEDQLSQQLYSQLLTRVYTADNEPPVMLLIAQSGGQTGVLQVHRPEYCYPAGGYLLTGREIHAITLPNARLATTSFTATAESRVEQLLYWTRVGLDMPVSWAQQRWSIARANLEGRVPDAVLVRVSTVSPDRERSLAILDEFTRTLVATVEPSAPGFLVNAGEI